MQAHAARARRTGGIAALVAALGSAALLTSVVVAASPSQSTLSLLTGLTALIMAMAGAVVGSDFSARPESPEETEP